MEAWCIYPIGVVYHFGCKPTQPVQDCLSEVFLIHFQANTSTILLQWESDLSLNFHFCLGWEYVSLDFHVISIKRMDIDEIIINWNLTSRRSREDCWEQIEENNHHIFYRLNRCLFHYVFQLRLEEPSSNSASASEEQNTESCTVSNQMVLPLELRITHFRDMLLERGVSTLKALSKPYTVWSYMNSSRGAFHSIWLQGRIKIHNEFRALISKLKWRSLALG